MGCMGRSRGGLTSKIQAIIDTQGRPVNLCLAGGQVADCSQSEGCIERIKEGVSGISCAVRHNC